MLDKINSLELYLNYPPGEVLETNSLEDVGCGIYPCYYKFEDNGLLVSTSAVSLILNSQNFELNPNFKPPDFLNWPSPHFKKIKRYLNKLGVISSHKMMRWYESWESIDKRIFKLKAFEKVTPYNNSIDFKPDYTICNKEEFITKSVYYQQSFVNKIEKEFPAYHHIVLTGGKDSQLISLIPKLDDKKWHIFSAEPNYPLIKNFVAENSLEVNKIFTHDNINEESYEDLKKKILCGDLYYDPRHIRWMPTLKKIAEDFNYKCIFWGGTAGGGINKFNKDFHTSDKELYFKVHANRICSSHGNYHQVCKNFTNCPYLSPYHSKEIWEDLYQHLDPSIITIGTDLRPELGKRFYGGPVKWPTQNPGPEPYKYDSKVNLYKLYVDYIKNKIH